MLMADESLYAELSKRIPVLEEEWIELSAELEEASLNG